MKHGRRRSGAALAVLVLTALGESGEAFAPASRMLARRKLCGAGAEGSRAKEATSRPALKPDCYALRTARQRGGIEVRDAGPKGLGVFATEFIPANTDIGTYEGETLTQREVDARYKGKDANAEDEAWVASRRERNQGLTADYILRADDGVFVDAEDTDKSNWCRFMNHADPENVRLKILAKGMDGKPRVWFVTRSDVAPGDELCYHYGGEYWD